VTDSTTPETDIEPSRAEFQFGLQALLCMFVVAAMVLSYIRTFRPEAVGACGIVATLSFLFSGVIGLVAGHFFALGLVLLAIGGHWLAIRLRPGA
jgi:hypothetical protein